MSVGFKKCKKQSRISGARDIWMALMSNVSVICFPSILWDPCAEDLYESYLTLIDKIDPHQAIDLSVMSY